MAPSQEYKEIFVESVAGMEMDDKYIRFYKPVIFIGEEALVVYPSKDSRGVQVKITGRDGEIVFRVGRLRDERIGRS